MFKKIHYTRIQFNCIQVQIKRWLYDLRTRNYLNSKTLASENSYHSTNGQLITYELNVFCTVYFCNFPSAKKKWTKQNSKVLFLRGNRCGWVSEWYSDKMTRCVTLARRVILAQRQNDTVRHFSTATKWHGVL